MNRHKPQFRIILSVLSVPALLLGVPRSEAAPKTRASGTQRTARTPAPKERGAIRTPSAVRSNATPARPKARPTARPHVHRGSATVAAPSRYDSARARPGETIAGSGKPQGSQPVRVNPVPRPAPMVEPRPAFTGRPTEPSRPGTIYTPNAPQDRIPWRTPDQSSGSGLISNNWALPRVSPVISPRFNSGAGRGFIVPTRWSNSGSNYGRCYVPRSYVGPRNYGYYAHRFGRFCHSYLPAYYSTYRYFVRPWYGTYSTLYVSAPTVDYTPDVVVYDADRVTVYDEQTSAGSMGGESAASTGIAPVGGAGDVVPSTMAPMLDLGRLAIGAGHLDEAREWFIRAMFAAENEGVPKFFYGLVDLAEGNYRLTAAAWREALENSPTLIDNPIDLRQWYPDEKALEAHSHSLRQFVEANSGDAETRFVLGYFLFATGNAAEARTIFDALSRENVDDLLALLLRNSCDRVQVPADHPR